MRLIERWANWCDPPDDTPFRTCLWRFAWSITLAHQAVTWTLVGIFALLGWV